MYIRNNVYIHTKYEVSMTIYMGMIANQRKIPKWLPFKNYKSEESNDHILVAPVHIHVKDGVEEHLKEKHQTGCHLTTAHQID